MGRQRRKQKPLGQIKRIHLIGIGGIGMSSIAEVLISRGFEVSGSDMAESDITARLTKRGAKIYEGHTAENVQNADVVVYSSAVKVKENPETQEAIRRHIPLIGRPEMLAELMRMKYGIGIAGTHGKTTTTSMTGLVVGEGDFDPTIIVGGKVSVFGSNAVSGEGDIIIIEADEYDRTFLRLTPIIAVITNIEAEHLDIYKDLDDIKGAFIEFANKVPFFGRVIACLDDANVQEILGDIHRPILTYGTARQAAVRADAIVRNGVDTYFGVYYNEDFLGDVVVHVPGVHNVRNALAAIAVGLELQVPFEAIKEGLDKFTGVQRRFQVKGEAQGRLVIDDYAHHPTEVKATLKAANEGWRERRIVAVFQPHLYSRTQDFKEEFARAFFNADMLVVTDIYPSRETPIAGVTGKLVSDLAEQYGHRNVHYIEDKKELPERLAELTNEGDVVITMGAGDIWRYGEAFLNHLGFVKEQE